MTWIEIAGWAVLGALSGIGVVSVIRHTMREAERRAHLHRLDEQMDRDRKLLDEIRERRKRDGARER